MAFAPRGTLARKREERALNDLILAQAACRHPSPPRWRAGSGRLLCDVVCPDCRKILRSYYREGGRWIRVGGDDAR